MEVKKKRGSNYTAAEKDILLEIIKKYENIIENKEINAQMIQKKRNAWNSVCKEFNAVAVSGFRTWQQLRHLYDNLKQRSKKNIGRENKEINRTGGGYYKSTPTKQDAQICKLVAQQVLPLSNPYDDAALYVGAECNGGAAPYAVISNTNHNDNQEVTGCTTSTAQSHISTSVTSGQVKRKAKITIKEQYFKAKLRNAQLENKYLINKHKMEINKYKIKMQILKLKLNQLKLLK